jgi:hypothetical protein
MAAVESNTGADPICRVRRVGNELHVTYRSGRRTVLPVVNAGRYASATAYTCVNGRWHTTAVNQ